MQDIVDYLFEYVQEHRLAFYLNADPEYQNAGRRAERALFRCGLSLGLELGALGRLPG